MPATFGDFSSRLGVRTGFRSDPRGVPSAPALEQPQDAQNPSHPIRLPGTPLAVGAVVDGSR